MPTTRLPIVILAGSDRRAPHLPAGGGDKHPLAGYKAVSVHLGGRTLLEALIERLERSCRFGPIRVVGPRRLAGAVGPALPLIESDGTFGENLRSAIEAMGLHHPRQPFAFIACDVLPDAETLERVMAEYDRAAPCDLWFPLVRAPEDGSGLGASAWKPRYRVAPHAGEQAVGILPGHLAIVDPDALRLKFLYRLFQLGYSTRNRSIDYRRGVMVRGVVAALLVQDLRHILSLRAPTLTWSVLRAGIPAARRLREGTATRERLERALGQMFVTARHRRRYPERGVRLPIVEGLSLALDIDTEEEAHAAGADVGPEPFGRAPLSQRG